MKLGNCRYYGAKYTSQALRFTRLKRLYARLLISLGLCVAVIFCGSKALARVRESWDRSREPQDRKTGKTRLVWASLFARLGYRLPWSGDARWPDHRCSNHEGALRRAMRARVAVAAFIWLWLGLGSLTAEDRLDKLQIVGDHNHFATVKASRDECRINFQQQSSVSESSGAATTGQAIVSKSAEGRIDRFNFRIIRCRALIDFLNSPKQPSAWERDGFFNETVLSWEKDLPRPQDAYGHVFNFVSSISRAVNSLPDIGVDFKIKMDVYRRGFSNIFEAALDRDFDEVRPNFQRSDNFQVKFNPWSVFEDHCTLGNISRTCRRFSTISGRSDRILHIAHLAISKISHDPGSQDQSNGRGEKRGRPSYKPPVAISLLLTVFGFLAAFFCALRAGYHLYEERRLRGALWLCGGAVWGSLSVLVILNTF